MKRNRRGQGLLEYIVILAAVLTAIIAFVNNGASGGFRDTMRHKVLDGAATEMDAAIKTINLTTN